ncbi:hypothetical protein HMPREF1989_01304 [Porphyromonas gingivalis F0566]|nr:hypothetical protein HMPREF1989_01304 [Porphyromonas gingivalis F0566]
MLSDLYPVEVSRRNFGQGAIESVRSERKYAISTHSFFLR